MNLLPERVCKQCDELVSTAQAMLSLHVINKATSVKAGFALKTAKEARRDLEDLRKQLTRPIDEEKKAIMNEFHGRLAACDVVIAHLERELKTWIETEKKRQAEEKRAAEEAAKKEQERKQDELKAEAKELEVNWDFVKAQEVIEKAEIVRVPVVVVPEVRPLIRGLTERKAYKAKVVDVQLIPRNYLIPDEKALGELARSSRGKAVVPGVEFYEETTIAG